jgi:hypothetical protein
MDTCGLKSNFDVRIINLLFATVVVDLLS